MVTTLLLATFLQSVLDMNSLKTKALLKMILSGLLDFSGTRSDLVHSELLLVTKGHKEMVLQKRWLMKHSMLTQSTII